MKIPSVAIILLNYNGKKDTFECLESLAKISYSNYKVFLVDNGSSEPIVNEAEARFSKVVIIENKDNLGFTGGNNIGCKAALDEGAEYILLLNNDTVVKEDFLDHLVSRCQKDKSIGMATPKIYFYGQDKKLWAYGAKIDRFLGRSPHIGVYQQDVGQYDGITDVDRITGCAMFVKKEVFDKVGMIDDRFFIYYEETDWCIRARKAGYKLRVVPESIIWHKGHRDSGRIGRPFIIYLTTRNNLLLLRKHSSYFYFCGALFFLYTLAIIVKNVLKALFLLLTTNDKKYFNALRALSLGALDGVRSKFGKPLYF